MNPPPKPSKPSTEDKSTASKSSKKENGSLKPQDFPSGDEEDREGGNTGPEEKRQP